MLYRYAHDGYGLYAVVLKQTGEMIGQCGLTNQAIGDKTVLEIGYNRSGTRATQLKRRARASNTRSTF